jgi:hypothetical protein
MSAILPHPHQALKVTPAMAAGVTKRLWKTTDLVEMPEAREVSGKPDAQDQLFAGGRFLRTAMPRRVLHSLLCRCQPLAS